MIFTNIRYFTILGSLYLHHHTPAKSERKPKMDDGLPITLLSCDRCSNRYKNPNHLKRHIQYECGKEPRMTCVYCFSKFKRPDSLRRHMLQSCPNKNIYTICEYAPTV